jgi:polysaccharide pyruvyl transferase WcaK-like protein
LDPARIARALWRASGAKFAFYESWARILAFSANYHAERGSGHGGSNLSNRVLVVPPDPLLLDASRGDQAMLSVVEAFVRDDGSDVDVAVHDRWTRDGEDHLTMNPVRVVDEAVTSRRIYELLKSKRYKRIVLVGADVTDGSYDPVFSCHLLSFVKIGRAFGADCTITGFSFSKKSSPAVRAMFAGLDPAIRINVRDPRSFARFEAEVGSGKAQLVADVAFLLNPDRSPSVDRAVEWIAAERIGGRSVVGLNFHPLLYPLGRRGEIRSTVEAIINRIIDEPDFSKCSFLTIEHDHRGDSADRHCMDTVRSVLEHRGARYYDFDRPLSAAELKCAVSYVDLVVTGRMHLAIAALGSGTPIFGLGYKDKIEGLLELAGLPAERSIVFDGAPVDAVVCGIEKALACILEDKEKIRASKLTIIEYSKRNCS